MSFDQSCLPSLAFEMSLSSVSSSFVCERGLVGEAREVSEERAEVLALVAGQVTADLDVGDRVRRAPGRHDGLIRGAHEGEQAGGRQGDHHERNQPCDRPATA